MKNTLPIAQQPRQRFIYAGNAYILDGDKLFREIYMNGDAQLNGLFKKLFKFVGKIVRNPIVGIALTVATGGAFGALSAAQLMAVNVAKGLSGVSGLINTRNTLKKQAAADKANEAYYNAQIALVDKQIRDTGNSVPSDPSESINKTSTDAIRAYAAYINAGGDPALFSGTQEPASTPNVTSYGLTPSLGIAAGFAVIGIILMARSRG